MRSNKKKIIMVVSIVIILSILITGTILFFTTNIFKSNQELFFKYILQNVDVAEQYLKDPNKLKTNQIESAPYVINSDISFDLVSSDEKIANQTTPPRNFSVLYTKNVDPINNRDYSEAKIKYLTKELFTAKYAHDGDVYAVNGTNAITSSDLFNVYLGIENKDLKQLAKKLGVEDVSNIPNKIEKFDLEDLLKLTKEEKQYIQKLLIQVVNSQIAKDNYFNNKRVTIEIDGEKVKTNVYGLKLTNEEYKNLILTLLDAISKDQQILNILLKKVMLIDSTTNITTDVLSSKIQEEIKRINEEIFTNGITIQVYEAYDQLVRTQIEKDEQQYYIIDHKKKDNSIKTVLSLNYEFSKSKENENNNNVVFTDDEYEIIDGSASSQEEIPLQHTAYTIKNIEFEKEILDGEDDINCILTFSKDDKTYKISLQNKTKENTTGLTNNIILIINDSDITYFTVKINSNIEPNQNITVQELNETNSAVLNNRTPENISQLLTAIKAQLKNIYKQQMEVSKQVEESSQTLLNQTNQNALETNTIKNRNDIVE